MTEFLCCTGGHACTIVAGECACQVDFLWSLAGLHLAVPCLSVLQVFVGAPGFSLEVSLVVIPAVVCAATPFQHAASVTHMPDHLATLAGAGIQIR